MADDTILTLTADIVAAHVSNNSVSTSDLPTLIQTVHSALNAIGSEKAPAPEPTKREPVVSPRSAIKPDAITCLICGSKQKMLKRHIAVAHGMDPTAYRAEFGLKKDYPMVAPNYAEQRRALAVKIGLGQKRRPVTGRALTRPKTTTPQRGGT